MGFPQKPDPVKHCETCGVLLTRKRFNGRLEDRNVFLRRRHCSLSCGNSKRQVTKDAHHWRARKYRRPACEECSMTSDLHVHHVDRNHTNNNAENLRTLCSSCHLKLHWREDRAKRVASAKRAAASRGDRMNPRSADGRWCSADSPLRQLS